MGDIADVAAEAVVMASIACNARDPLDVGLKRAGDNQRIASIDQTLSRFLDIHVSLILLLVLAPLMVGLAALILITTPGPVIFGHPRVGKNGRTFCCLKFRSMVSDSQDRLARLLAADPEARRQWERDHKLRNDPRVTLLGRFLRRSSLDELPQLFNVLSGDMSLVGPRPIVREEVCRYGRYFHHYARVRPGITGLWQISGRSNTSYRRRVALDVTYSRSQSFMLNIWILMMTVPCVLFAEGSC